MVSDSPFSSSVLVVGYHVGVEDDRMGFPLGIAPDEPFPLRQKMIDAAHDLKVITEFTDSARGAATRQDLHLTQEHFLVPEDRDRMADLLRDTEALQAFELPAHQHPNMEFVLVSHVRDQADPTASIALQIGVTPNGSFTPTTVEAMTRDGQSYSGPLPRPSQWKKILDDGRAWEGVAAKVVQRHRAEANPAGEAQQQSGIRSRLDLSKLGERIRGRRKQR